MTTYTNTEALFIVDENQNWKYENITIEPEGTSAYIVYITFGDTEKDFNTVVCKVPHQMLLLSFLAMLTNKNPLFTTLNNSSGLGQ